MRVSWIIALCILPIALIGAIAGSLAARHWHATPKVVQQARTQHVSAARGEVLFQVHCAKCHGSEGRGDAEAAAKMIPAPRDFASRPWKFEPTSPSIARVIERGSPGSTMPAFAATLSTEEIAALTQHVLSLSTPDIATADDPFASAGFARVTTKRVAPELKLELPNNGQLALSELRGRLVLLNFWGVTCPHCLERMPALAKLQLRFAERELTILNICADEADLASALAVWPEEAKSLTVAVDSTGLANSRYEVSLLPTIWLIDRDGKLLAKTQGARDWNDQRLVKLLEECLAAPKN